MMSLAKYLTPDPSLRAPPPCPEFIPFTQPSRGSRRISLNSRGSVRGFFAVNGFQTWYEAELEHKVALALLADPRVRDIIDQPTAVTYIDDGGVERRHTFDWLVLHTDVTKTLVAVKPSDLVEKTGIDRVVKLVAQQIAPPLAHKVLLITEQNLTRTDNCNARLIYSAGRDEFPADDARVAKLIAKLRGPTTIERLVKASRLGGSGFNAVVRAIACGRLALTDYRMIDYDATVMRSSRKAR